LSAGDGDGNCEVTEDAVVGTRFDNVVRLSTFTLGVDMSKIRGGNAGDSDGRFHGTDQSQSSGLVGGTPTVAAGTGSQHFSVNVGSATDCVLVAFDEERRGTFADDGTVAFEVKRATGSSGVVGASGEAFEAVELGDVNRVNV
jgi:hypothetical protein